MASTSLTQTQSTPAGLCNTLFISSRRQTNGGNADIIEEGKEESQRDPESKESEASLVSATSKMNVIN